MKKGDDPAIQKLRLTLHKIFEGEPDTQKEVSRLVDEYQKLTTKKDNDNDK